MLTEERKAMISERLRRDGRIVAKALAQELGLSEDTIRRDLREMASDGLLARVHGGALPLAPALPDLKARMQRATAEKQRLGQCAAALIKAGQTIFIDGGSTHVELVRALPRSLALTVVTHSPTIATELEQHPAAEIILIGGKIYRHSMVAVGAVASAQIATIRPDIFFLGATAVHPRYGFSTGDFEEAAIKRQIAAQSAETWVLATAEKLDRASPVTIMPLEAATGVVVDGRMAGDHVEMLAGAGLAIERA